MTSSQVENGRFQTSDMALAAFLYYHGANLVTIDKQNPRRCTFIFGVSPEHRELISGWRDGSAMVGALGFMSAYRTMKARVFGNVDMEREENGESAN